LQHVSCNGIQCIEIALENIVITTITINSYNISNFKLQALQKDSYNIEHVRQTAPCHQGHGSHIGPHTVAPGAGHVMPAKPRSHSMVVHGGNDGRWRWRCIDEHGSAYLGGDGITSISRCGVREQRRTCAACHPSEWLGGSGDSGMPALRDPIEKMNDWNPSCQPIYRWAHKRAWGLDCDGGRRGG
jgi:hypothetical protein